VRVNARFEGEYERQVEYLTQATGMGVSDVLKASVEYYYQAMRAKDKPQLNNLREFIGKLDSGRSDVATRYKEILGEAAAAKHGKLAKSAKK
jgi:predicted Ser/Thr protein kinase